MTLPLPQSEDEICAFAKRPWRRMPQELVPICCPITHNQYLDAGLSRAVFLCEKFAPATFSEESSSSPIADYRRKCIFAIFCGFALAIEGFYRTQTLLWESRMRILLWLAVIAMVCIPSYLLFKHPDSYNPLVQFLFSVGLCWASIQASAVQAKASGESEANRRWLPQAEGVCDRLITLKYALKSFWLDTKHRCNNIGTQLPELLDPKNNSIRAIIECQCSDSAHRIEDFINQLDSAVSDWHRFIRENCKEGECETIFDSLDKLNDRLHTSFEEAQKTAATGCHTDSATRKKP